MVGVVVIVVVMNVLEGCEFFFVFGGDGVSFVVVFFDIEVVCEVFVVIVIWVRDDFDLLMWVVLVLVSVICV